MMSEKGRHGSAEPKSVVLDGGQRMLHGDDGQVLGQQEGNDLVPAGAIGPGPVNGNGGGEPTNDNLVSRNDVARTLPNPPKSPAAGCSPDRVAPREADARILRWLRSAGCAPSRPRLPACRTSSPRLRNPRPKAPAQNRRSLPRRRPDPGHCPPDWYGTPPWPR